MARAATSTADRPAPAWSSAAWSAEWSMMNEEGQDLGLVAGFLFEDYLNLLALEEALASRREDLGWMADGHPRPGLDP